jgi:hypothetical protein
MTSAGAGGAASSARPATSSARQATTWRSSPTRPPKRSSRRTTKRDVPCRVLPNQARSTPDAGRPQREETSAPRKPAGCSHLAVLGGIRVGDPALIPRPTSASQSRRAFDQAEKGQVFNSQKEVENGRTLRPGRRADRRGVRPLNPSTMWQGGEAWFSWPSLRGQRRKGPVGCAARESPLGHSRGRSGAPRTGEANRPGGPVPDS